MRALQIFILLFPTFLAAQITTENKQSAEFYIKNVLMGPGVVVGNIKHVGMIGGLGQFKADSVILGVKSGLVLSSGNVDSIQGPNDKTGSTTWGKLPTEKKSQRSVIRGDRDLNRLCKGIARDMTIIEFDFVPVNNVLEFKYVFASEEYPEYVGSPYNDAFGFFLSGPGIKGKINLAVLPDGKTPISVNTINAKSNNEYFRKNYGRVRRMTAAERKTYKQDEKEKKNHPKSYLINAIQFDGITTVLKVHADVIPYQKYHLKIGVADAHDKIFDSAVFLEAGSFLSVVDTSAKYAAVIEEVKLEKPNADSILLGLKKSKMVEPIVSTEFDVTSVYFSSNASEIPDSTFKALDQLAAYLMKNDTINCFLLGYTDSQGTESYNLKLSKRRAQATKDYLVSKGIKAERISIEELGISDPDGDNTTEAGRALNRRVEVVLE